MTKKSINLHCNLCNEIRTFDYYGYQVLGGRKVYDLYNCRTCKDTRAVGKGIEFKLKEV